MKKILIIEDELAYLKLLQDQLIKNGYEVITASNGKDGLLLALLKKPGLILLDLLLPKMSGLVMLDSLRRFDRGDKIPVFVLTNINGSKEISETMHHQVSEYIIKSDMKIVDLLLSIKRYLK